MEAKWVPGECHGHIFMDAKNLWEASDRHRQQVDTDWVRAVLEEYHRRGITFFREGGDPFGVSLYTKQIAEEYELNYLSPVFAIHRNRRYGRIVGRGFEDLKEYHALVREVKRLGGDFIKVMFSGIVDFGAVETLTGTPLEEKEISEMIRIAHEEGMAVMAHVNGDETIRCAIEAGVDSVEHGNFMKADTLKLLAKSNTFWVPTVSPIANLLRCNRFPEETVTELVRLQKEKIKMAWDLGAKICLGSDAGAFLVFHGSGLEDEWNLFEGLGLNDLENRLRENEKELIRRFDGGYR